MKKDIKKLIKKSHQAKYFVSMSVMFFILGFLGAIVMSTVIIIALLEESMNYIEATSLFLFFCIPGLVSIAFGINYIVKYKQLVKSFADWQLCSAKVIRTHYNYLSGRMQCTIALRYCGETSVAMVRYFRSNKYDICFIPKDTEITVARNKLTKNLILISIEPYTDAEIDEFGFSIDFDKY